MRQSRWFFQLFVCVLVGMLASACRGDDAVEHEGDDPGECSDGADNDLDGMFDCDDSDCSASPSCRSSDGDADADADVDGGVDADDADTVGDADADADVDDAGVDADVDVDDAGVDADADVDDADVDVDTDMDGDTDADVDTGLWPCHQSDPIQLRITSLHFSDPETLANGLMAVFLHSAIDEFLLLWLMELDLDSELLTTGAGQTDTVAPYPDDPGFCLVSWHDHFPPASSIPIEVVGNRVSTTGSIESLSIPIHDGSGTPMFVLPLYQVRLSEIELSDDRVLVGSPESLGFSMSELWHTAGSLTGWIRVDDAMAVSIEAAGGASLCALLAGTLPGECEGDPRHWPNSPETIPGSSDLGFFLEADVGAGAVTIDN